MALESFQIGLMVLYPPTSTSPRHALTSPTTTKEAMREDLGLDPSRMGRHHTRLTSFGRSESYPHLSNNSTENTEAKGFARDPCRM